MLIKKNYQRINENGSIIVSILVVSLFFVIITSALLVLANSNIVRAKNRVLLLQAQYAAESGADSAVAQLNNNNDTYTGTGINSEVTILNNARYKSTYATTVTGSGKQRTITAIGKVYIPANSPTASFTRNISVEAEKSSTTSTSSIVSQFNIDINSAVKTVNGKNIYVNGFINMNKTSTDLISEDITVVGKNTSASNCSIGGSGDLKNPTTFSTPGQTKMNVKLGYSNCVTLTGGASLFNLQTNQTNLTKIQSTLIPVSQYMDSSYQNSVGGDCRDWTTGGTTKQIPSTGNTKKTHYPDSSAGTSASCGTAGNLDLGTDITYVLNDHVHIRANFCYQKTCRPIFKNPTTDPNDPKYIKFLFVEGAVYFDSIRTTSDSGPIVIVAYGTDTDFNIKNSLTSECEFVPSIFLGQGVPSGYTNAPKLYMLAPNNGVCLDKTKFGAQPGLGGISGKNIYINTNSGSPFDLYLDPTFPTNQIQVDLSWRAVKYRRL